MVNLFLGWSEADLLAALRAAQEEAAAGSQIESAGSGDVSSSRRIQAGPAARIRAIGYALNKLDPFKYPARDYCPTNRTVAVVGLPTVATPMSADGTI